MNVKKWLPIVCITLSVMLGANISFGADTPPATPGSGNSASDIASSHNPNSADSHISDVFAITKVFADGLKVSGIAIKYDKDIDPASLSPSDYVVKTDEPVQKITGVYATTDNKDFTKTGQGPYVVLELSTDYQNPVRTGRSWGPRPQGAGDTSPQQHTQPPSPKVELSKMPGVVLKAGNISWDPTQHPGDLVASSVTGGRGKSVTVTQVGDITTADGATITSDASPKNNYYVRNLMVDEFMKPDFRDSKYGGLKYSIYFPANYNPAKKYPVVEFMGDSNCVTNGMHDDVLTQGLGGVVWAEKSDEAKHPAIVVAPLPMGALLDKNDEPAQRQSPDGKSSTPYLATLELMDYLLKEVPNIDRNRIYVTGQGDGANVALRMMSDRPDLYAAALLFAPDYSQTRIAKLSKAKMWIVVAEGDEASYASMNGCIDSLKAAGASIGKAEWNGRSDPAHYSAGVHDTLAQGGNINYTVLKKGTILPPGVANDATNIHAYTWRVGYSIEPLRDWLFAQKK